MHIYIQRYMHAYTYIYIYILKYIHIYIYILKYIHIYIHTYMHACITSVCISQFRVKSQQYG